MPMIIIYYGGAYGWIHDFDNIEKENYKIYYVCILQKYTLFLFVCDIIVG